MVDFKSAFDRAFAEATCKGEHRIFSEERFESKHYMDEKKFKESGHVFLVKNDSTIKEYARERGISYEQALCELYPN